MCFSFGSNGTIEQIQITELETAFRWIKVSGEQIRFVCSYEVNATCNQKSQLSTKWDVKWSDYSVAILQIFIRFREELLGKTHSRKMKNKHQSKNLYVS